MNAAGLKKAIQDGYENWQSDTEQSGAKWWDRIVDLVLEKVVEYLKPELAIREEVMFFAKRMEAELLENDDKGGWYSCTFPYLVERMREEIKEVVRELNKVPTDWQKLISESADVGNFSMMIADKARNAKNA